MTFDEFISFCRDFGSAPDDWRQFDDMYKAQGWSEEDRWRLCRLHAALEHLRPGGPDFSEDDEKKAFAYWWDTLPGREELKLEVWRRVFCDEPLRKLEAEDISVMSPAAREIFLKLLEDARADATLTALGVFPWSEEWRRLSDGEEAK